MRSTAIATGATAPGEQVKQRTCGSARKGEQTNCAATTFIGRGVADVQDRDRQPSTPTTENNWRRAVPQQQHCHLNRAAPACAHSRCCLVQLLPSAARCNTACCTIAATICSTYMPASIHMQTYVQAFRCSGAPPFTSVTLQHWLRLCRRRGEWEEETQGTGGQVVKDGALITKHLSMAYPTA